jgi:hypothetical protein
MYDTYRAYWHMLLSAVSIIHNRELFL